MPVTSMDAAIYKIKQALIEKGLNPDDYQMQIKTLRVARPLTNGQGVDGAFDIQRTKDSKTIPYETLLEPSSLFGAIAVSAKAAKIDANGLFVGGIPSTYPEPDIFDATNEAAQLAGLWYGGKLSFVTNENTTRFSDFDLMHTLYQPNRISAAAGDPSEFGASMAQRGFQILHQLPIVEGGLRNEFFLKWGAFAKTAIEGTNSDNHAVLEVIGVEFKNAAGAFRAKMGEDYDAVCNPL